MGMERLRFLAGDAADQRVGAAYRSAIKYGVGGISQLQQSDDGGRSGFRDAFAPVGAALVNGCERRPPRQRRRIAGASVLVRDNANSSVFQAASTIASGT